LCSGRAKNDSFRNLTGRRHAPERDEQLSRQRYDHRLACAAASVGRPSAEPLGKLAVFLKLEEAPGQLDHSAPYSRIAGAREAFFTPPVAALIGRTSEAGIAGNGFAIRRMTRQDLIYQHVRRLDADAHDPCYEADDRVGSLLRGCRRLELAQPLSFDFLNLLAHNTKPRHVAAKLPTRILRQKRSFGGVQFAELFFGLA